MKLTRRQWVVVASMSLLLFLGGALSTGWGSSTANTSDFDVANTSAVEALRVDEWREALVQHDHWGRPPVVAAVVDEDASTFMVRVVGVETSSAGRHALLLLDDVTRASLLPAVDVLASGLIRITGGDALTDRISVVAIGSESVELLIDGATVVHQLYSR